MTTLRALLHETRWRPYWRGLLILLLFVVATLAFLPDDRAPDLTGYDKTNHLLAFAALAFAGALSMGKPRWTLIVVLVAYGGFIEVVQSFLPTRHGEWADLAADSIGILLGLGVVALARRVSTRSRS